MTAARKKIKKMKGRPRGGASVPCPDCGANSRVIITKRDEENLVVRKRECLGRTKHTFTTKEDVV